MGFSLVVLLSSVVLIYKCKFNFASNDTDTSNLYSEKEAVAYQQVYDKLNVFYSLPNILKALKSAEIDDRDRDLLLDYMDNMNKTLNAHSFPQKHPFIVVEGSRHGSRQKLAVMLAENMGARKFITIPKFLFSIRRKFFQSTNTKQLFFAISVYISSWKVRVLVPDTPVVMDGYWMKNALYRMVKEFTNASLTLPPPSSPLYEFPKDLFKPDMILYLNACNMEKDIKFIEFTEMLSNVYRLMRNPRVLEIKKTFISQGSDMFNIRRSIKEQLAEKFPEAKYLDF